MTAMKPRSALELLGEAPHMISRRWDEHAKAHDTEYITVAQAELVAERARAEAFEMAADEIRESRKDAQSKAAQRRASWPDAWSILHGEMIAAEDRIRALPVRPDAGTPATEGGRTDVGFHAAAKDFLAFIDDASAAKGKP